MDDSIFVKTIQNKGKERDVRLVTNERTKNKVADDDIKV